MGSLALRPGDSLTILKDGFVNGLQELSLPPSCHSSYGAWTLTPVGLAPTDHASLRWTHTFRYLSALIFSVVILAGCASKGSEFLGSGVNTHNAADTFQVVRNGDQFLIVNNGNRIGATHEKGTLEVKGVLVTVELTYDRKTDTILTPGFFGQTEYRRTK